MSAVPGEPIDSRFRDNTLHYDTPPLLSYNSDANGVMCYCL